MLAAMYSRADSETQYEISPASMKVEVGMDDLLLAGSF